MEDQDQFWMDHSDKVAVKCGNHIRAHDWCCDYVFKKNQSFLLEFFKDKEGLRILDVGCGNGLFTEPLSAKHEVAGIDFSYGMVALASEHKDFSARASAEAIPFQKNSFDAVVCIEMLQCVEDGRKAIEEMVRVLKPGGLLVIQTLNKSSWVRQLHRLFNQDYRLLHMYSVKELSSLEELVALHIQPIIFNFYPLPLKGVCRGFSWLSKIAATSLILAAEKRLENKP